MSIISIAWTIIVMPLTYLGQYPGVTLVLGCLMLFFTIKKCALEPIKWRRTKLWLSAIAAIFYGLYDIIMYQAYPMDTYRFDLFFIGAFYYFALLNWILIYRKVITI
jgi:hypothetical protein